jgi:hypothetical protein
MEMGAQGEVKSSASLKRDDDAHKKTPPAEPEAF